MNTKLPSDQVQFCLPNLDSLESSEQAFANAFLRTAQILHQCLEQIKSVASAIADFTNKPFNLTILGLFGKMSSHYYSYVLLEIYHQDRTGSNFLSEQLAEAAITLTYLLEEADNSLFSAYISDSIAQAKRLLGDVTNALQQSPTNSDLLQLKAKLEAFVATHQEYGATPTYLSLTDVACITHSESLTAKRAQALGFKFIINPARTIALQVEPASWLDLHLNHSPLVTNSSSEREINFTQLRDASHLCLHAARTFLDEIEENHYFTTANFESQQRLNMLYEWFYNAHQLYSSAKKSTEGNDRPN